METQFESWNEQLSGLRAEVAGIERSLAAAELAEERASQALYAELSRDGTAMRSNGALLDLWAERERARHHARAARESLEKARAHFSELRGRAIDHVMEKCGVDISGCSASDSSSSDD
jgi:hypothetical protein